MVNIIIGSGSHQLYPISSGIMEIKLNTGRHCIETEMKRQYNKTISAYFKSGPETDKQTLEARIDLLQQGLENFDFNRLRANYPELRGETEAEVTLAATAKHKPELRINGEPVHADQ